MLLFVVSFFLCYYELSVVDLMLPILNVLNLWFDRLSKEKNEHIFVSREERFIRGRRLWMFWKRFEVLKPIIFYIWKWFERVSFALKVKIIFESTKAYNKTIHLYTFIHRMTNHKIWIQIKWVPFVISITHCVWFCLWIRKSFIQ